MENFIHATGRGTVYLANTSEDRVDVHDDKGRYQFTFGEPGSGPGQFSRPMGVATDARGRIWVCDSGNHRVSVFGVHRNPPRFPPLFSIGSFGSGPGQFDTPASSIPRPASPSTGQGWST